MKMATLDLYSIIGQKQVILEGQILQIKELKQIIQAKDDEIKKLNKNDQE